MTASHAASSAAHLICGSLASPLTAKPWAVPGYTTNLEGCSNFLDMISTAFTRFSAVNWSSTSAHINSTGCKNSVKHDVVSSLRLRDAYVVDGLEVGGEVEDGGVGNDGCINEAVSRELETSPSAPTKT